MKKRSKGRDGRASRSKGALSEPLTQRVRAPGVADSDYEPSAVPALEAREQFRLASAKTQWFLGDWDALITLDSNVLSMHPDRDRLALLAASAHAQLGNDDIARRFARAALDWGCSPQLMARILIAGVHNTLGKASALNSDEARMGRHFKAAVTVTDRDASLPTHVRAVRELARLGLFSQAAKQIAAEASNSEPEVQRPASQQSRMKVLETELELLRHALTLAQKRKHPLLSPPSGGADEEGGARVRWLAEIKSRSLSQLGQDLWVLERTGYKRGGFFVEFGASDGVTLSNTWLLETYFDWNGICAEPNPKFFKELLQNRNCTISNACVGARTGEEVDFVMAGEYGGMRKHADLDSNAERRSGYVADAAFGERLCTVSLEDLLVKLNAPRTIDYLSIDTEGSEYDILAAFPFEEWQIGLITAEHNFTPQRERLRELLGSKGYAWVEAQWDDWYYLKT